MNDSLQPSLTANQLAELERSFHQGSRRASEALEKWVGRPAVVAVDTLALVPLEEATQVLAAGEGPVCFCAAEMHGLLTGELILVFDDASGFALADMLLGESQGTISEWSEMALSAALETTNIVGCAFLNSLSESLGQGRDAQLLPSPPRFSRDFAESLMQFALMGQATASDQALVARTRFEIDAQPVHWTLLWIPDAESMLRLPELLATQRG